MKKIIPLVLISLSLAACSTTTENTNQNANNLQEKLSQTKQIPAQPDRKMDLYGKIISNEGNEFTIQVVDTTQDPTFNMSSTEKRAYMQKLSQEARMALKDKIRNAILGNEKVLIPVGTPIVVKLEQGPDGEEKMGSLADLTAGSYVTIWLNPDVKDRKIAEYVKRSYTP